MRTHTFHVSLPGTGRAWRKNANPDAEYPRLVESVGEAPPQYPDWDDDEDW